MFIPPISVLAISALFIRKELLIFFVAFFAGGILSLKYPVVASYMNKGEQIVDKILIPDLKRTKEQVEILIEKNI
jgi:hypothetical protein